MTEVKPNLYESNCESDAQFESTHPYSKKIPQSYLERTEEDLRQDIRRKIKQLGDDLLIMAHHYQKDEVVEFAEVMGDSLYLAQAAQKNKKAKHIIFCGVHFMAETAAMLTEDYQSVYLPDENAGCFMADMAQINDVERAWKHLTARFGSEILPVTYVNSTAEIKAFVGRNNGTCVTSTNAPQVIKWALSQGKRVFFLPDQHLGRNTAYALGEKLDSMSVWDYKNDQLIFEGNDDDNKIILWDGYCGVHQQFTVENVQDIKKKHPDVKVIVHPECSFEVVQASDFSGSTNALIKMVDEAPDGSVFAIGTDNNLVARIKKKYEGKKAVHFLNFFSCSCVTMNRIRLPHLAWNLDNILNGDETQKITVADNIAKDSIKSIETMFSLT